MAIASPLPGPQQRLVRDRQREGKLAPAGPQQQVPGDRVACIVHQREHIGAAALAVGVLNRDGGLAAGEQDAIDVGAAQRDMSPEEVRARILEELPPEQLYREVRAAILPDTDYHGPEEEQLRQAMLELAARLPPPVAQGLLQASARASGVVAWPMGSRPCSRPCSRRSGATGGFVDNVLMRIVDVMLSLPLLFVILWVLASAVLAVTGSALLTIGLGNIIVLAPILLNSHPGTKYGIPFPIFARASYGGLPPMSPVYLAAIPVLVVDDSAFMRRLEFIVDFEDPGVEERDLDHAVDEAHEIGDRVLQLVDDLLELRRGGLRADDLPLAPEPTAQAVEPGAQRVFWAHCLSPCLFQS